MSLPRPGSRRRLLAAVVLLLMVVCAGALRPTSSRVPYALDNPHPDGAQALGVLLREEGVRVRTATSVSQALDAAASGPVTIAVISAGQLSADERSRLAASGADLTVLGTLYQDLSGLSPARPSTPHASATGRSREASNADEPSEASWTAEPGEPSEASQADPPQAPSTPAWLETSGASAAHALSAQCADPDAQAAGSLQGTTGSLSLTDQASDAVGCFPLPGTQPTYAYVSATLAGGGQLRAIADAGLVTNARLAQDGHAALAVRALGHQPELIWFDAAHASALDGIWHPPTLPPWLMPLLALGVATALTAALAGGRRFGRLVSEDLPVVVEPTQTTVGRAQLYRRSRARREAARALRAGTGTRLGRHLGVPRPGSRSELVAAIQAASTRSGPQIDHLLYGPPPADDQALIHLAHDLTTLESEILPDDQPSPAQS